MGYLGAAVKRLEDRRLVTGSGTFVDDIHLPGTLHAAVLRSPYAHARVRRIEASRALRLQGVRAVFTWQDLGELANPLPPSVSPLPAYPVKYKTHYALVRDKARYVGEPVAFAVAEDPYVARDAVELIEVDYEPLEPVVDLEEAVREGTPLVHEDMPRNIAAEKEVNVGDYKSAEAAAKHMVELRLVYNRGAGHSIETRAVLASFDRKTNQLTVWDSTQAPIPIRNGLAKLLKLPETNVRVIAPDVGGGFGPKIMLFYPEEVLVSYASMLLGQPVKWVETRTEYGMCANQERHQIHYVKALFDLDGRILGLSDNFLVDTGAYTPYGVMVPIITMCTMPGPYRLKNMLFRFTSVFTNKTIVSPVRGAGRPTAVFVMERVMDKAARILGMSRDAIRRINLIGPGDMPWDTGLIYQDGAPNTYDSGNYPAVLENLLSVSQHREWEALKRRYSSNGRRVGFGLALYVEGAGVGPYEMAKVRVGVDGRVLVSSGVGSQGQGHQTFMAQIVADVLGVRPEDVEVSVGDTGKMEWGVGTFASRSAAVAAPAVFKAASKVREKMLRLAAKLLEVSPQDLEVGGGRVYVRDDPSTGFTLAELAAKSAPLRGTIEEEPGLEATDFFSPQRSVYSSGGCVVMCSVDTETGYVKIEKIWLVHDCGNMINPMIVEGQIHGGLSMGVGSTLYEEIVHDEAGNPLTANFADYLLPSAVEMPAEIELAHFTTPTSMNPLGVKGVGEAGVIPVAAAVASAVDDALNGNVFMNMIPIKPSELIQQIRVGPRPSE